MLLVATGARHWDDVHAAYDSESTGHLPKGPLPHDRSVQIWHCERT